LVPVRGKPRLAELLNALQDLGRALFTGGSRMRRQSPGLLCAIWEKLCFGLLPP
jgi:hypothetical protein